ncbi:MAG: hypothetical protein FWD47_10760 [Treponema sp.]|nr:hypothetical protein [Treponema sp.]
MEEFIKSKMNIVFSDFLNFAGKERLCELKDFNYCERKFPIYNNIKHQQLYLLRYFPAYLSEYKYLYQKITNEAKLTEYNVLSIGCGCFLDYHGLVFALSQSSKPIKYTGIDIIEWNYNHLFLDQNIQFSQIKIEDYEFPLSTDHNIIFFPKSLSEIPDDGLNVLLGNLQKINFTSDYIYLVSSTMDKGFVHDEGKYKRIISAFENISFYCNSYQPTQELKKKAFLHFDNDFYYPDSVKNYLNSLHEKCVEYTTNNKNCKDDCINITRSPILTTNHVSFIINILERKI